MLPSTCVVVPTYWTRASGETCPGDAPYDHPTPVSEDGTLPSLLESLAGRSASFLLVVLVGVVSPEVAAEAETRVRKILRGYDGSPWLVVGQAEADAVRLAMPEAARGDTALTHYPLIRNLQLAIPFSLGSEAVVALDDDEIVTEVGFMSRAVEPLGRQIGEKRVDGLSGYYLQPDGTIYLRVGREKADSANIFDRKAAIMNEATRMLEEKTGNIVVTPFCFGGNMEFSRELVGAVGFDPGITRGEDIDYLINARMEGRSFFLRKDLRILHRPPSGGSYRDITSSKTEQDVRRFIYERVKIDRSQHDARLQPVTVEDLSPYPGAFLGPDIGAQSVAALRAVGFSGDAPAFVAREEAEAGAKMDRYMEFRERWPRAMAKLGEDQRLRERLLRAVEGAS